MSKERFRIKLAVYLIPRKDNQVLLSRRFNTGYMDGHYSFVAGHVDGGETADEALARETKEETGVEIPVNDRKLVYTMHRLKNAPEEEYVDLFFESRAWKGDFINQEPNKCDDLSWFDVTNLPESILPYIRSVIEKYEIGQNYEARRGGI